MNISQLKKEFVKIYGGDESDIRVFASPGRVNLIGEHTDYNGGYVFPAALKMNTTVLARKRDDDIIRLKATDLENIVEADIKKLDSYKGIKWGDYQIGVMYILSEAGYTIVGADLLYHDTVPHGSGLSSSAANEVSTALCFATLSNEKNGKNEKVDMIEMAKISQKAEREYAGVNCGIMDQFASSMGKENHAIFLDCKTLDFSLVPLDLGNKKIVISNTNKKHALGSSKYNERRAECEKGLEILKSAMPEKNFLGEISKEEFDTHKHLITDEVILKRVTHVIEEDDRVLRAVDALKCGDIETFGKLMNSSHDSLRDNYEVSCFELDTMVDEARKIKGVIGSRMTGAGFGGCTVSIVDGASVDEYIEKVGKNYEEKTGIKPDFYVTETGDGGKEIL
ncbi:MAG: galactokinase [Ruminococcaceae bacterium]|nr:galactokinase [Oscillospiraceae bacterium]